MEEEDTASSWRDFFIKRRQAYFLTVGEVQGGVSSCGSLASDWLRGLSTRFVFI